MPEGDVHMTWREEDAKWAVVKEGNSRASSLHDTKEAAQEAGRQAAKREKSELLIHCQDGQIQERSSYGRDPHSAGWLTP